MISIKGVSHLGKYPLMSRVQNGLLKGIHGVAVLSFAGGVIGGVSGVGFALHDLKKKGLFKKLNDSGVSKQERLRVLTLEAMPEVFITALFFADVGFGWIPYGMAALHQRVFVKKKIDCDE